MLCTFTSCSTEEIFYLFAGLMEEGGIIGFFEKDFPLLYKMIWHIDVLMHNYVTDVR